MSSIIKPVLGSQLQLSHPLARGLVGCWLMNEGSGNKVFNLSGNGNGGILTAGAFWLPGISGSSVNIPGSDNYINYGDYVPAYFINSDFTVVCKICQNAVDTFAVLIGNNLAESSTSGWALCTYTDGTGNLLLYTNNTVDGYEYEVSDASVIPTVGRWYEVAIVYVAATKTVTFYVDGIDCGVKTFTKAGPNAAAAYELVAGVDPRDKLETDFNGKYDHKYLYNRVLSDTEIAQLYREPFCMFERDPIELWSAATLGAAPPVGMAGAMTTNTGYWGY